MPPIDPALGLSGALTVLQQQPPLTANTFQVSGADEGQAAAELSRAARSLESVQGNVSGQTLAIQQMTMASQQQATNLQLLMTQLGNQIAGLSQALSQLSSGVQMSAAMSVGPAMATMSAPMAQTGWPAVAPAIMGGVATAGRGMMAGAGVMHAFGSPFGRLGAGLAAPFFGAPVFGPAPGMFGPQISPDAGFMRSMGIATGLGIQPEMMRQASAAQLHELGRERMQQRFGDLFLGTVGGAAQLGGVLASDLGGDALARAMGLRGLTGFAAGALMSLPISAAIGAGVNETMGQVANIRGFGEQFARNAFRFMPQTAMGMQNLRRPDMYQRSRFGQAVNRMAIEDLTFNEQDMTEMFAGMTQQDLLRGVQNVDEVVQKFRQTKETFKLIGRRMGQGLQEAADIMGVLQELGFDSTSARGRAAVFGASSVMGLTPGEAMNRAAAFGGQFAGQGIGREMFGVGLLSQQMAQASIASGALSNIDIAALGGREGAGQAVAQLMGSFLNSPLGQATLLAGPQGAGLGVHETMALAGRRASTDINLLINMQLGGEDEARKFLSSPHEAQMRLFELVSSMADQFQAPGVSRQNAMRIALKQLMPSATGQQITAILKMFGNLQNTMRQEQAGMLLNVSSEISDQNVEQLALMAKAKRGVKSLFTPLAEVLESTTVGMGAGLSNLATDIERDITGTEMVHFGRNLSLKFLTGGVGGEETDIFAKEEELDLLPNTPENRATNTLIRRQNAEIRRNNKIREEQKKIEQAPILDRARSLALSMVRGARIVHKEEVENLKQIMMDGAPEEKRRAAKRLLDILSDGTYDTFDVNTKMGAANRRAFQLAIQTELGVDVGAALVGKGAKVRSLSRSEQEVLKKKRSNIANLLDLDDDAKAAAFEHEVVQEYVNARLENNPIKIGEATERALKEGFGDQIAAIDRMIDKDYEVFEFDEGGFGFTDAEDRLRYLRETLSETTRLGSREKQSNRLRELVGNRTASILKDLRSKKGLALDTAGSLHEKLKLGGADTVRALGQLPSLLNEEALRGLESGDIEGGRQLAMIIRQLRGITIDDGLNESEQQRLAKLMGLKLDSKEMRSLVDDVKRFGDFGTVIAAKMNVDTPGDFNVLAGRKRGITDEQMSLIQKMQADQARITELLERLSKHKAFQEG